MAVGSPITDPSFFLQLPRHILSFLLEMNPFLHFSEKVQQYKRPLAGVLSILFRSSFNATFLVAPDEVV